MVKVEAYNGINSYLSELSDTRMKTLEDIIKYNQENSGTEGAEPGDHPAFPVGQVSHSIIFVNFLKLTMAAYLISVKKSTLVLADAFL